MKKTIKKLLYLSLLCTILIVSACGKSRQQEIAEQLELGQKYLSEQNYEAAIVAFTRVIELDPRQTAPYLGRAEAYYLYEEAEDHLNLALADYEAVTQLEEENIEAYLGLGKTCEKLADQFSGKEREDWLLLAAENYEHVQRLQPSDSISCERLIDIYKQLGKLVELLEMLDRHQNEADSEELKLTQETIRQCMEYIDSLRQLCEEEDLESIFSFMQGEGYQELQVFFEEFGTTALMTEDGKGLGLYHVATEDYGNMMIYYGEYEGEQRQGEGMWIGYHDGNNYYARGSWADDLPNGSQEVREWNEGFYESVIIRVIRGTAVQGYWNGPAEWGFEEESEIMTFSVSFTNGKFDVLDVDEVEGRKRYTVSDTKNGIQGNGGMHVYEPDKLEGIEGFIL